MKNQENLITSHRSDFVIQTLSNSREDLAEAQRQFLRSNNKLLAIAGTGEIRRRLTKLYELAEELDDELYSVQTQIRNKAELLREMPLDKGEAFERGLFAKWGDERLEGKTGPNIG